MMTAAVAYGPHERQVIGIYNKLPAAYANWIVFIHGGAWRDPSNTYRDGDHLLNALAHDTNISDKYGYASIDYRLSPEVRHPSHISDVVDALKFLSKEYGAKHVILVGHSAGAFLAFQAVVFGQIDNIQDLPQVDVIFGVDGIFDLPSLVAEYPEYSDFVENAFGDDQLTWEMASPLERYQWTSLPIAGSTKTEEEKQLIHFPGKVIIAHSPDDELLSMAQPDLAENLLASHTDHHVTLHREMLHGLHDDVYKTDGLVSIVKKYL